MRAARSALLACALAITCSALAMAAALPKTHTDYIYVHHAQPLFSVNLATSSATRLVASHPRPKTFPSSSLLVLCPGSTSSHATELQMGFAGARLTRRNGHYRFRVSYTESHADLVAFPKDVVTGHESAHVTITGTVESAKLITGTVSVTAKGCSLKTSRYRATRFKPGT